MIREQNTIGNICTALEKKAKELLEMKKFQMKACGQLNIRLYSVGREQGEGWQREVIQKIIQKNK